MCWESIEGPLHDNIAYDSNRGPYHDLARYHNFCPLDPFEVHVIIYVVAQPSRIRTRNISRQL